MPPEFNLTHIDLSSLKQTSQYKAPLRNMGGGSAPRIREEHADLLLGQLQASFQEIQQLAPPDERFLRPDGGYYEVELRRGADPGDLSRARDQIIAGGAKVEPQSPTRKELSGFSWLWFCPVARLNGATHALD